MATQAMSVDVLRRHCLEACDLRYVSTAFHVQRSRPMAGLTTVSVVQRGFEVWGVFEILFVQVLVTGLADIDSNVLRCVLSGRRGVLYLLAGRTSWLKEQQNKNSCCRESKKLSTGSHGLHSRTPCLTRSTASLSLATLHSAHSALALQSRSVQTHFSVLVYSAIALACSSLNPAMPLLCGALLPGSPLVMCSTS